jgi:hypothetical protein
VEFKLHPVRSSEPREVLKTQLNELRALARQLWFWLESRRLCQAFSSTREYIACGRNKCPEVHPLKCRLLNLKTFGPRVLWAGRANRYPRERLFHALCLMLFEDKGDGEHLRQAAAELRTSATSFAELVEV